MTTSELARKAGQSKSAAKIAAAARNGRAGRQSIHPAVVAAREWWRNASPIERMRDGKPIENVLVLVSGGSGKVVGQSYSHIPGVLAVPVSGGSLKRFVSEFNEAGEFVGRRAVNVRVQCGPLAKEEPAPTGYVCAAYLRDLARQAPELRDAWQIAEIQRALNSAAELIERLRK